MAVRARLNFDTVPSGDSARINYRLDILDDGYSGVPLDLIANGDNPVVITGHKDDDPYKSLKGSSLKLNLTIPNADYVVPDFNAGSDFQYEVILRRVVEQRQASNTTGLVYVGDVHDTFGLQSGETWRITISNSSSTTQTATNRITGQANSGLSVGDTMLVIGSGGNANSNLTITRFGTASDGSLLVFGSGVSGNLLDTGDGIFFPGLEENKWCGYINPIESREQIKTYPYFVSFTATDRIGLLNQQSLVYANVLHDPSLIGYVGRALRQTGLNIPLYVDTGIHNANGDVILDLMASEFSFFDNGSTAGRLGARATLKESLAKVSDTLNCKVYQSDGKFWLTSNSLHGNATDTNVVYAQYVPDLRQNGRDANNRFPGETGYIATTNIEEYTRGSYTNGIVDVDNFVAHSTTSSDVTIPSLRYVIDGSNTADADIIGGDLFLTLREAYGSVEARPEGLFQDPLHPNTDFSQEAEGWSATGSLDSTLIFSSSVYRTGGRSITTTRNRQVINASNEVWFRNTETLPIDPSSPTSVSVIWRHNGAERDIRIPFRIRLTLPTAITYDSISLGLFSVSSTQTVNDTFYWDFNLGQWEDDERGRGYDLQSANILGVTRNRTNGISTDIIRGGEANTWLESTVELAPSNFFRNLRDVIDLTGARMEIEFFYHQSYRGNNGRRQNQDSTSDTQVWIDRVAVNDNFSDDILDPVYEYRQPNHTLTENYAPAFISSGPQTFRQFLQNSDGTSATDFWRKDETSTQARSLEELVTGQKLADNKERLPFYEGVLLNLNSNPIAPHNKIQINYPNYPSNGIITQCGYMWNVKQNTYDFAGYTPDLNTLDTNDSFTPYNVDLVAARFDGTRASNRYVVAVTVRGIAANAFGTFAAGDVVSESVVEVPIINETEDPGQQYSKSIEVATQGGFVTSGLPTLRTDTETTPHPQHSTLRVDDDGNLLISRRTGTFNQPTTAGATTTRNVGGGYALTLDIVQPDIPDFDELHIDVPVTAFVAEQAPGLEEYNVTLVNNVSGTVGAGTSITIPVRGSGGNNYRVPYTFAPADATLQEVLVGNVNDPSGSAGFSISSNTEKQVGGSVEVEIDYEIRAGGATGDTITYTGAASNISTATNPTSTFSGNFTTSATGFSFTDPSYSHTGNPATTFDGSVILEPDEGEFLTADGFDVPSPPAGVTNVRFRQVGENVQMLYTVTFGNASVTNRNINVVTDTTAVRNEPYSVTFVANNLGINGGRVSFGSTQRSTIRLGYVNGDSNFDSFELRVMPDANMLFSGSVGADGNSNEVLIDINEASVINNTDGTRVTLPESQFTVTRSTTPVTSDGILVFDIDGTFPTVGGQYIIDVNVTGAAGYGGAYSLTPSSNIVAYDGSDLVNSVRYGTIFVPVVTTPVQGRFTATVADATTGGVDVFDTGIRIRGFTTVTGVDLANRRVSVTLTHQDDSSVTTTVVAADTLSEAGGIDTEIANTLNNLNVPEYVNTSPVQFSTGTSTQSYIFQYMDGSNMLRTRTLNSPDSTTVCVAGDTSAEAIGASTTRFVSNPGNDGTITTGGGINCELGSLNATTVSGISIDVNIGGTAGTTPGVLYIT